MPRAAHLQSLTENLTRIFDTLYIAKQISRPKRLQLNQIVRNQELLAYVATHLYGPTREVVIPGEAEAKQTQAVAYYITNQEVRAEAAQAELFTAIREHWGCEADNWLRDVTWQEDQVPVQHSTQAHVSMSLTGLRL